jgi:hypothetical protein
MRDELEISKRFQYLAKQREFIRSRKKLCGAPEAVTLEAVSNAPDRITPCASRS